MVRCLRISGDLNASIEVGERVMAQLAGSHLESCDESVQLAVTVAAGLLPPGRRRPRDQDVPQGHRQGRRARLPVARASAYWNASVFEAERGSVSNAVPLAERALVCWPRVRTPATSPACASSPRHHAARARPARHLRGLQHLDQGGRGAGLVQRQPEEIAAEQPRDRSRPTSSRATCCGPTTSAKRSAALIGEAPTFAAHAESLVGQISAPTRRRVGATPRTVERFSA